MIVDFDRKHLPGNFWLFSLHNDLCYIQNWQREKERREEETIAAYFYATCISCIFLNTQRLTKSNKKLHHKRTWTRKEIIMLFNLSSFLRVSEMKSTTTTTDDGSKIFEFASQMECFSASINCRSVASSIWCRDGMRSTKTRFHILCAKILIMRYDCLLKRLHQLTTVQRLLNVKSFDFPWRFTVPLQGHFLIAQSTNVWVMIQNEIYLFLIFKISTAHFIKSTATRDCIKFLFLIPPPSKSYQQK